VSLLHVMHVCDLNETISITFIIYGE